VRFEVLTAASMKMAVFWVVATTQNTTIFTKTSAELQCSVRRELRVVLKEMVRTFVKNAWIPNPQLLYRPKHNQKVDKETERTVSIL
jgi:hypothetical protein